MGFFGKLLIGALAAFGCFVAAATVYHLTTEDYERAATSQFVNCMELLEKYPTMGSRSTCDSIKEKTLTEGERRASERERSLRERELRVIEYSREYSNGKRPPVPDAVGFD